VCVCVQVKVLFAVAGVMQPSVIFIDEIDSIMSARKADGKFFCQRPSCTAGVMVAHSLHIYARCLLNHMCLPPSRSWLGSQQFLGCWRPLSRLVLLSVPFR
jgi:hypothetical protein